MKCKKGQTGEGILEIFWILVTTTSIAFFVLFLGSVYYSPYIDIRDAEAEIMAMNVVDCFTSNENFNFDFLDEYSRENILDYCGFESISAQDFYVNLIRH